MSGRKFRENALKRRAFYCRGILAPLAHAKAHTAPHVRTQAGLAYVLVGSVPLHHKFFNALLFSCDVHSLELLLIELLYA